MDVVLRAMLYMRPRERHQAQPQGENVDTAFTRALNEKMKKGKVAVEQPGGVLL